MLKVKFVDFWAENNFVKETILDILNRHFEGVVESEDPDFLFYSASGHNHLNYNCVRIMFLGENLCPDFNICDYAIGFNYIDFEDRYLRFPLYYFYRSDYELAIKKHAISEDELLGKKKFCNFVYSNANGVAERKTFFELLSKYKKVDSGGKFLNNIGGAVENKLVFQQQYKFSIAFENSSTNGYTTEKIIQAFAAGTIPIYWGDPKVGQEFNEKSFINCHNYNSFEEVVQEVERIDKDEKLFRQYIEQPIYSEIVRNPFDEFEKFIINICSQLPHEALRRSNTQWGERYQDTQKNLFYIATTSYKDRIKNHIKRKFSK